MHSWQQPQAQAFHLLLQAIVVLLATAFLPEHIVLFNIVVAFLQEVHALLQ
jgi:hypothetical protein